MFLNALIDWKQNLQNDEWYFTRLRENIENSLTPEQAYHQISDILDLALEQKDKSIVIEVIWLAQSLIRKADTTEIPEGLPKQLEKLNEQANTLEENSAVAKGHIKEIQKWFRIS